MILFIFALAIWLYFHSYEDFVLDMGFSFPPLLIFLGVLFIIITIFLNKINNRLKALPGNEERSKVFINTWIVSFFSIIILLTALSIIYRGYTFIYFEEMDNLFIFITIFTAIWMVYFFFINILVEIPKQKKYTLLTILYFLGITTFISFIPVYEIFGYISYYEGFNDSYIGLFGLTMPFVFTSIYIGYLGYAGLRIKETEIRDNIKIFYTRSTNYYLLLSLPVLFIPLLAFFQGRLDHIYQYYFNDDYWTANRYYYGVFSSTANSTCCLTIFLSLIIIIYSSSRIYYEKKYKLLGSKKPSLLSELLKNKLGLMVFIYYLVAVLIIASLGVSYMEPTFEKKIIRDYHSPDEYEILQRCEDINYADHMNLSLFDDPFEKDVDEFSKYIWFTFINNSAMDYFSKKIQYYMDNKIQVHAWLEYSAKVFPFGDYQLDYFGTDYDNVNETTGFRYYGLAVALNDSVVFDEPFGDHYIYSENFAYPVTQEELDDFQVIEQGYNYSFENSYMVQMSLMYTAYHPPDYQYFNFLDQIIVMDEEFNVKLILVDEPSHYIWPDYPPSPF